MTRITRYLLHELMVPFLLGIALFTFILLFGQIFELTDYVVNRGLPLFDLLLFILMGIPETLPFTLPMALLLAVLMAYGRLASDHELTVMRASGCSLPSLIVPPLVVGLLLAIAVMGLREFGLPPLARLRNHQLAQMKQVNPVGLLQPQSTLQLGKYSIYAERVEGKDLHEIEIIDHSYEPPLQILSQHGRWVPRPNGNYVLQLRDGQINQRGKQQGFRVLNFNRHTIEINLDSHSANRLEPEQKSLSSLYHDYQQAHRRWKEVHDRRARNPSSQPSNQLTNRIQQTSRTLREKSVYFHQALAYPFASFFLVLIAAPLGMLARQSGKSMGFGMSLVIILVYYVLKTSMEQFAINGWLPPAGAIWFPNLLFGAVGGGMLALLVYRGK